MIRVSVFYTAGGGKTFNHDYYVQKHMPLADVPNFTSITPQVQISEIILQQ